MTTDKFVEDYLERNIICDLLSGRMSLIHEYGENKYNDGKDEIEQVIRKLLKSGEEPDIIAQKADVPLEKLLKIKERNNLEEE
ncbi:hypothetical protein [Methanobrevibacter sp.]|uniref:hypothetical protein n=1 Tax=Methanobrevibacter sp. TaxID=66852 RepID=UPI0026DEC8E9|nr:hypothetical protein [Methanobrevibacter sp.]MDO5859928.1 hypothetical protein [Methanobrevibacter sp.]